MIFINATIIKNGRAILIFKKMNYFFKIFTISLLCSAFIACQKPKDLDKLEVILYSGNEFINERIIIETDQKLIIEAGSQITFGPLGSFLIEGEFEAIGTSENPIALIGSSDNIAHTILNSEDETTVNFILHHVNIENGLIVSRAENHEFYQVHISNEKSLSEQNALVRTWKGNFSFDEGSLKSNNTGEGLLVHQSSFPLVNNSTFIKIPDAVEILSSNGGQITNSTFMEMNDDAIDLNNCIGIEIINNEFYKVKHRALEIGSDGFGASSDIEVRNNLFVECHIGINVKESSAVSLQNATFFKTKLNVELLNEGVDNVPTNLEIMHSVIFGDTGWFQIENNSFVNYKDIMSNVIIEELPEAFVSNITFADTSNNNFKIISKDFPIGQSSESMGYQKQ